jgi:phosphoglycolate phosphatase-like HAD superfamily hydrolase
VRDLFVRFRQSGVRTALASSSAKADLDTYMKIANISDLIDETTSADDADRSKPHPDIFSATLHKLHAKPTSVLALGDTPYDAESAGKAGIRTIGVTTGGWSRRELLEAGCIEVYQDVAELLERFDQSALMHYGPS